MAEETIKYYGTGRRKSSVARVYVQKGQGRIRINKRQFEDYFPRETHRLVIVEPLKATNSLKNFDVDVIVSGGGATGQAGALRLGLSRALVKIDEENNKSVLKKNKLLRRDSRMKERKKPGQKGARKKFQWVKR